MTATFHSDALTVGPTEESIESAFRIGAIAALRHRAEAQRQKAQSARWSEADTHRRIAKTLAEAADALEAADGH
jgi:hypothetical protein